jgi:acetyl esterase
MLTRRRFLQGMVATGAALAVAPALDAGTAHGHAGILAPPVRATSYDPTQSFEVEAVDVPYRQAGQQSWLARVYQPQGSGPFPALLEIHGGVWTDNDRVFDEPINKLLAASGLVVFAIDFRGGATDPYPSSLADINLATRWVKAHAAEFNADPRLVGGFGGSSGGHLIMLSAMRPKDPRYAELPLAEAPDADASLGFVVAHTPVIDPASRYEFAKRVGRADLITKQDGYFGTVPTMDEGNPLQALRRQEDVAFPPMLILHGTADMNVPIGDVEEFPGAYRAAFLRQQLATAASPESATAAYRAAGSIVELQEFPGAPHYFLHPVANSGPQAERGLQVTKEFIARQVARLTSAG